jgi:hypothetical protein
MHGRRIDKYEAKIQTKQRKRLPKLKITCTNYRTEKQHEKYEWTVMH